MIKIATQEPIANWEVSFHPVPESNANSSSSITINGGNKQLTSAHSCFDLGIAPAPLTSLIQDSLPSGEGNRHSDFFVNSHIHHIVALGEKSSQLEGCTCIVHLELL